MDASLIGGVVMGMLAFVHPYKQRMIGAFLLTLLVTGFTLLTPYLIRIAIDDYIAVGNAEGLATIAIGIAISYVGLYLSSAGTAAYSGQNFTKNSGRCPFTAFRTSTTT